MLAVTYCQVRWVVAMGDNVLQNGVAILVGIITIYGFIRVLANEKTEVRLTRLEESDVKKNEKLDTIVGGMNDLKIAVVEIKTELKNLK